MTAKRTDKLKYVQEYAMTAVHH